MRRSGGPEGAPSVAGFGVNALILSGLLNNKLGALAAYPLERLTMPDAHTWNLTSGAAHRLVGGEYFVVTDDRAFHHIHVSSAVALFRAFTQGPQTTHSLVSALVGQFEVAEDVATQDVNAFVAMLVERRLAARTQSLKPAHGDAVGVGE